MKPLFIKDMIKNNTLDDHINIKGIANNLRISIVLDEQLSDLARISMADEQVIISLKADSDKQVKYSLMVIAMADYILTPKKVAKQGINYDMFFINDIFAQRQSYQMLLATRLAFPEKIIKQLCNQHIYNHVLDYAKFIADANYMPQFVRSCIDDSSNAVRLSIFFTLLRTFYWKFSYPHFYRPRIIRAFLLWYYKIFHRIR